MYHIFNTLLPTMMNFRVAPIRPSVVIYLP